ncbi:MAG: saccharopine dehydrogenase NADP-binding domain-containing protein [Kofleriaceae bacterium]
MPTREFDVVLFGATGFTGRLVAAYLAGARADLRWAVAGRRADALAELAAGLTGATPQVITADANDADALAALARRTRVVASTAGPFARLGGPLVAACVGAGTHYADLTGEVTWVAQMIEAHHAAALASGARIVHCCGFDSIPSDLGAQLVIDAAHARHGAPPRRVVARFGKMRGGVSGGTVASALAMVEAAVADRSVRRVMADPYALTPGWRGDDRDVHRPGWDAVAGTFTAPFVMAGINSRVVRRSRLLLDDVDRARFAYDEQLQLPRSVGGAVAAVAVAAGLAALPVIAATSIGRRALAARAPAPGTGPSPEAQARGRFVVDLRAELDDADPVTATVRCDDADPGYAATARMLGESALCLAFDELASPGGVTTPAAAMGPALRARLDRAGVRFELR